jgi:two-component system copper resistance phosphate regulon response regulator CusR
VRVLVVEDERKVADALREGLEAERYEVTVERTGTGAFERLNEAFDLILLDLGLPGRDGLEVLQAFRQRSSSTPVVIISARDSVQERVAGLDAGADDYVIKPFAFGELLARIRALSRRTSLNDWAQVRVGTLFIDRQARHVSRGDQRIELTHKEYELLEYLARYQGQVVSREALAREVWQETFRSTTLDNVIDVHIARLRRKLDTDPAARLIHTVKGVGFLLREGEP